VHEPIFNDGFPGKLPGIHFIFLIIPMPEKSGSLFFPFGYLWNPGFHVTPVVSLEFLKPAMTGGGGRRGELWVLKNRCSDYSIPVKFRIFPFLKFVADQKRVVRPPTTPPLFCGKTGHFYDLKCRQSVKFHMWGVGQGKNVFGRQMCRQILMGSIGPVLSTEPEADDEPLQKSSGISAIDPVMEFINIRGLKNP
jgi:hypothetical protein